MIFRFAHLHRGSKVSLFIVFQLERKYVRTTGETMTGMKNDAKYMPPHKLYAKYLDPNDKLASSKNLKQAQNVRARAQAEERGTHPRGTIADQIEEIYKMRLTNRYIQWVISPPGTIHPSIIMYDQNSINDLRNHITTASKHPTTGNYQLII